MRRVKFINMDIKTLWPYKAGVLPLVEPDSRALERTLYWHGQ